jgi:hypothetical protein
MTRSEFERLALTYGAGVDRWPARHQTAARRLLEEEPDLIHTLRGASCLDAVLESLRTPISERRLARVKSATLAYAAPARATASRGWLTSLADHFAPVTLGTVVALCLAWFVHHERPPPVTRSLPSTHLDVVSELLDDDSAIFREDRR